MKKLFVFLFALGALLGQAQLPAPGLFRSAADARYGAPPSTGTLGPSYAAARAPVDVWGLLTNGWGGFFFNANQQPVPLYTPNGSEIIVNPATSQSITSWTVGTNTATIGFAAGHGFQAGDMFFLAALPGGISGISIGQYPVTAVTSTSITITCPTTTGTYTSGGTGWAIRDPRLVVPGNDSTGNGTIAAPYASIDKAQNVIGTAGNATVLIGPGVLQESSGGNNRFIPNQVFTNWVRFTSFNGRASSVVISNSSSSTAGIFNVRSASFARYQFDNVSFTPQSAESLFAWNPSANNITVNGFHVLKCILNAAVTTSGAPVAVNFFPSSNQAVTGISGGNGSGPIVVTMANTGLLAPGSRVSFTGLGGATQLNGSFWTLSSVSANASITLSGSNNFTVSAWTSGGSTTWNGCDAPVNDVVFQDNALGNVVISGGTNTPQFFAASPLASAGQNFYNFGFFGNSIAKGATYAEWSANGATGFVGFTAIGNVFKASTGHGFLHGNDLAAIDNSGWPMSAPSNLVYVAGNAFSAALASNGHGGELGQGVIGGIFEYNIIDCGLHGIVIKGNSNCVARHNFVRGLASGAVHGLYPKATWNCQLLDNICVMNQSLAYAFYENQDLGASGVKIGNTTLWGNWLIADGTTNSPSLLLWQPGTSAIGFGVSDYNIYELRAGSGSPAWGTLRSGTLSSVPTPTLWATYGLGTLSTSVNGSMSGGNGSNVVIPVASTSGLLPGNTINVVAGTINGFYQIGLVGSSTITLANTTTLPAQSASTGTITYQFADLTTNDAHSEVKIAGSQSTRDDVVYNGGNANSGQTIYCEYVYQDGRRWNGSSLEWYNPNTEYRYACFMVEDTVAGVYYRPNNKAMNSGYWMVTGRRMVGPLPSAGDPIVFTAPIGYHDFLAWDFLAWAS